MQTLSERNSVVNVPLDSINPVQPGEQVLLAAAGATADTLTMMAGTQRVFSGEINIEAAADVVDMTRDALINWTNKTGGPVNLEMVFGAATSGFVLMVNGRTR